LIPLRRPTKRKFSAPKLRDNFHSATCWRRSLQNLNSEIKRKYEDYLDIAKGMNHPESGSGDIQQRLDVKRLERINEELMRLEGDQVKAEISGADKDLKIANQRIEQLRKGKAELEKTVARRAERSVDLITRKESWINCSESPTS